MTTPARALPALAMLALPLCCLLFGWIFQFLIPCFTHYNKPTPCGGCWRSCCSCCCKPSEEEQKDGRSYKERMADAPARAAPVWARALYLLLVLSTVGGAAVCAYHGAGKLDDGSGACGPSVDVASVLPRRAL